MDVLSISGLKLFLDKLGAAQRGIPREVSEILNTDTLTDKHSKIDILKNIPI